MICQLPRKVRRAIASITSVVSHETKWGCYTQSQIRGYVSECRWQVTGGLDLEDALKGVEVSVTSTRDGIVIVGLGAVRRAREENRQERTRFPADADLQNKEAALDEIWEILKVSSFVQKPKIAA